MKQQRSREKGAVKKEICVDNTTYLVESTKGILRLVEDHRLSSQLKLDVSQGIRGR